MRLGGRLSAASSSSPRELYRETVCETRPPPLRHRRPLPLCGAGGHAGPHRDSVSGPPGVGLAIDSGPDGSADEPGPFRRLLHLHGRSEDDNTGPASNSFTGCPQDDLAAFDHCFDHRGAVDEGKHAEIHGDADDLRAYISAPDYCRADHGGFDSIRGPEPDRAMVD